jgi:hypothetical protein
MSRRTRGDVTGQREQCEKKIEGAKEDPEAEEIYYFLQTQIQRVSGNPNKSYILLGSTLV